MDCQQSTNREQDIAKNREIFRVLIRIFKFIGYDVRLFKNNIPHTAEGNAFYKYFRDLVDSESQPMLGPEFSVIMAELGICQNVESIISEYVQPVYSFPINPAYRSYFMPRINNYAIEIPKKPSRTRLQRLQSRKKLQSRTSLQGQGKSNKRKRKRKEKKVKINKNVTCPAPT